MAREPRALQEAQDNEYVRLFDETQRALIDDALDCGYLRRYEAAPRGHAESRCPASRWSWPPR